ncbi:hypothetical protein AB7315_18190 [Providencia manganoxydans]|uniref:hypothetical protein n=1 Tax=Providencia manganoxydans TaxID=2923283 RepID=UPI0034E5B173
MDKSRQQFEEVFSKEHPNQTDSLTDFLIKDTAWNFWKLSRESLGIELPDLGDVILDDYFVDGFNDAISEVEKILISNGVKIKNE